MACTSAGAARSKVSTCRVCASAAAATVRTMTAAKTVIRRTPEGRVMVAGGFVTAATIPRQGARASRDRQEVRRRRRRLGEHRPRCSVAERLVLLGPSGCGKTTLLRLLAGLKTPDAGKLWIGGRVVNDLPPAERDVAMVFQNYALYPHFTVFENIPCSRCARGTRPMPRSPRRCARRRRGWSWKRCSSAGRPSSRWPAAARGAGARDRAQPRRLPDGRACSSTSTPSSACRPARS